VKLVAIHPSPAPYTTPIFNALAKRLDFHALYLSTEDRVSLFADSWGIEPQFEHSRLWSRRLSVPSMQIHAELSLGVTRHLNRLDPDAILVVSWRPTSLEPLLWARWSGSAAVMWSESTAFSGHFRGTLSSWARRWMIRMCDGYVTNGSEATQYLESLGVKPDRIVTSRLPAAQAAAATTRSKPTAGEGVDFLFVGRLIPSKRPLELIEAFRALRAAEPSATLTVVGGGELEAAVRGAAKQVPGVRYAGWLEGDDLASLYLSCDVLVMPAVREVWGVVVNEALSHGLFVVATDEVGSAHDLLGAENGLIVPAHDLSQLAASLVQVSRTVDRSDEARQRRAATMAACTPERFAADTHQAVEDAISVRGTP